MKLAYITGTIAIAMIYIIVFFSPPKVYHEKTAEINFEPCYKEQKLAVFDLVKVDNCIIVYEL